ncbi:hypothetical protein LNI96_11660 [Tenacibaculum dicentrarchi]|nr:hypothetical protein [Tenacibaculum dicentrarchi]MCD8436047.1 hypothetical protein [Tenacibaculum dicentrarchi]MCD8438307.1 hypothetical protein [Tenacibaculum dicentrarchi]WBX67931.1 hypothetical protein PG910_07280 [Tenacibaculum dicentrarchi]
MFKLHKKDTKDNILYAECWTSDEKLGIVHTGKVGKDGNTEEFVIGEKFKTSSEFMKHFEEHFKKLDYSEFNESNLTWLVVQFEMKSLKGNKRDHWLKEKVSEYLSDELGWRGIGHIDGSDMGEQIAFKGKYALNIFCEVYDEEKGIAAIKRCLREYRLDYTRIKIASRPYLSDGGFQLKYSAKKKDQTFSI